MSEVVTDVLEVLRHVRKGYRPNQKMRSIKEARVAAIREIGKERGVTHQTIADAYLRRLKPFIVGTTAFDIATRDWLEGDAGTLRKALHNRAASRTDELEIDRLLGSALSTGR